MDAYGRLLPCPVKFPSSVNGAGFKPLADRIHDLGLKFGIHIMRGIPRAAAQAHMPILGSDVTADMAADPNDICPWNPDMYGLRDCEASQKYYDSLLQLYASWGVDFIKCDDICATGFGWPRRYDKKREVEMLHHAIEHCGRDIVLSLSPGPAVVEESWHYKKYANMWRITDDFWDDWNALLHMFDRCEKWQDHVAPGCWPDCDMLPLGKVGKHFGEERDCRFTPQEQRTMMTLWSIFHSPLMLGADTTQLDAWTLSLLTNEQLLRLHGGAFCSRQVMRSAQTCIWTALDVGTGEWYIALFNLTDSPREMTIDLRECADLFPEAVFPMSAQATEIWSEVDYPISQNVLTATVEPHGTLLFHNI